jgi:hypothetical protein
MKCQHCAAPYTVPVLAQPPVATASVAPSSPPEPPADTYGLRADEPPASALPPPPEPRPTSRPAPPPPPPPRLDGFPLPQPVAGYQHVYSIWISPRVVQWLPPAALAAVFCFLFFPWIVVLSRLDEPLTGWQLAFGAHFNVLGLIFTLLFLLSLIAAIAAVVLPRMPAQRVHPSLHDIMPFRAAIVSGLTILAFFFLALEVIIGFGAANEPSLGTGWLRLAILGMLVAAVSAGLEWWVAVRGPQQPLPRIDLSW